jgi:hypothetical protein
MCLFVFGQVTRLFNNARLLYQVFKDATTFFSRSTSNIANVIPAMDRIDEVLATHSVDKKLHPAICAGCHLAKKTVNRYYNKTDHSENFRIAMSEFCFTSALLLLTVSCSIYSLAPSLQENLLQERRLGRYVDRQCRRRYRQRVHDLLRPPQGWGRGYPPCTFRSSGGLVSHSKGSCYYFLIRVSVKLTVLDSFIHLGQQS